MAPRARRDVIVADPDSHAARSSPPTAILASDPGSCRSASTTPPPGRDLRGVAARRSQPPLRRAARRRSCTSAISILAQRRRPDDAVAWLRARHPVLASLTLTLLGRDAGAPRRSARAPSPPGWTRPARDLRRRCGDETCSSRIGARRSAYPSRYEVFGLPVLEAMACPVQVVASTAASVPEVAGDADSPVDPLDARGWSEALAAAFFSRRAAALRDAGFAAPRDLLDGYRRA